MPSGRWSFRFNKKAASLSALPNTLASVLDMGERPSAFGTRNFAFTVPQFDFAGSSTTPR